jgi:folylpolyglutamate synthase/dihydropteroate synthase
VGQAFSDAGVTTRTAPSVAAALEEALAEATARDLICVTGSLYVVGEARGWLLGIMPDILEGAAPSAGDRLG